MLGQIIGVPALAASTRISLGTCATSVNRVLLVIEPQRTQAVNLLASGTHGGPLGHVRVAEKHGSALPQEVDHMRVGWNFGADEHCVGSAVGVSMSGTVVEERTARAGRRLHLVSGGYVLAQR